MKQKVDRWRYVRWRREATPWIGIQWKSSGHRELIHLAGIAGAAATTVVGAPFKVRVAVGRVDLVAEVIFTLLLFMAAVSIPLRRLVGSRRITMLFEAAAKASFMAVLRRVRPIMMTVGRMEDKGGEWGEQDILVVVRVLRILIEDIQYVSSLM